jgi:hypothetical protein
MNSNNAINMSLNIIFQEKKTVIGQLKLDSSALSKLHQVGLISDTSVLPQSHSCTQSYILTGHTQFTLEVHESLILRRLYNILRRLDSITHSITFLGDLTPQHIL